MITYVLLVLVYSANNLPYSALSGVITGDMGERNSISSFRFVAVMIAQFTVQGLLLPLVLIFGDGDKAAGFENVMGVFAVVGVIFLLITFFTTKERIVPTQDQKSTLKEDLGDLFKNKPWIAMLLLTILIFVTLALKGGMYIYYFDNYLDENALSLFLNRLGFVDLIEYLKISFTGFDWPEDPVTSAFSLFNAGGIIFMIVGIGFSKPLADKFGKRDVFVVALIISTLCVLAFWFFPVNMIGVVFIAQILHGFFYGITIPLLWAMIADVADYSEWKNNRRATAIIFSAMIFGLKAGLSIGGALVAGVLATYGYNEQLTIQSPETVNGIKLSVSVYPSLTFLAGAACLLFYEINKKMEVQIEQALKARRQ
ncbi:MFS transporter [Saccharicrinis fermentans]|nr:MFS transporter [Saccharicrinis fermentans]GAF03175.1 inner membrane symporter YicJ [Saccharicrinis fermentans DSM 9555 = JCM 21142]